MPHAKLSPSAAHRWMNCAGSVKKIGDEPSTAGMPAMLGTAAHKVIEYMLKNNKTNAAELKGYWVHVKEAGDEESLIFSPDDPMALSKREGWFAFLVDDDMIYGVQTMIDEVARVMGDMTEPVLFTERYLDGTWLDPRLGGTADVTGMEEIVEWIHLFDYKNGRVIVEVDDNEQMKNYAVFLLHEHPGALGVVIHLVQPNAAHEDGFIRTETYTADELKMFEIQLKEAADAVTPPNAPLRAGDWCVYCPAKDRCPAFDALMLAEAAVDFAEDPSDPIPTPMLVDSDEVDGAEVYRDPDEYRAALARRARWIPLTDQAVRDIRAKILAELMNQQTVGDWKLVRGKSNRIFPDEIAAQTHFNEQGIGDEPLFEPAKLKSPAKIEKLGKATGIKPAVLKKIVAEVAHKPEGKISIAPGTDAREALDPATVASQDFADDPAEDFEP